MQFANRTNLYNQNRSLATHNFSPPSRTLHTPNCAQRLDRNRDTSKIGHAVQIRQSTREELPMLWQDTFGSRNKVRPDERVHAFGLGIKVEHLLAQLLDQVDRFVVGER